MDSRTKPVVVVVSEGGVIQALFSNLPPDAVEIVVMDHDLEESDDQGEREFYQQCLKRAEPLLEAGQEVPRWEGR